LGSKSEKILDTLDEDLRSHITHTEFSKYLMKKKFQNKTCTENQNKKFLANIKGSVFLCHLTTQEPLE
jgi:hypothetical protein